MLTHLQEVHIARVPPRAAHADAAGNHSLKLIYDLGPAEEEEALVAVADLHTHTSRSFISALLSLCFKAKYVRANLAVSIADQRLYAAVQHRRQSFRQAAAAAFLPTLIILQSCTCTRYSSCEMEEASRKPDQLVPQ